MLVFVLGSSILLWPRAGKEEMPEFEMNWLRIMIPYPGAAAEDVEVLVTRPIEQELRSVAGIYEVQSTSAFGSSNFRVTLSSQGGDTQQVIQEIKSAVDRAQLPTETEPAVFSRFTSAEKAIIDIAVYHSTMELVDVPGRQELQKYALILEDQLLARPEISGIERQAYLKPEIQIQVDREKLKRYDISLTTIREKIFNHHVRTPVGAMSDSDESELSLIAELDTPEKLRKLVVRGGFEGNNIRLEQVATVEDAFAKSKTITKVQGHEALLLKVKKSSTTDILNAQKAVVATVERFKKNHANAPVGIALLDDESYDVRNRLNLIGSNGIVGFILIVITLFLFLDLRSGLWVAMGVPFSLAMTLLAAMAIGYTINNITLAAVIVVLGVVVDDAIIIADSTFRMRKVDGMPMSKAVVESPVLLFRPILASILTTCAAFIPLYFFSGRFGVMIRYIPAVVILMLAASFLESLFILPSHLNSHSKLPSDQDFRTRFMGFLEKHYLRFVTWVLTHRTAILTASLIAVGGAGWLFSSQFKFVLFPREEASEIIVRVISKPESNRFQLATDLKQIEQMFLQDQKNVSSVLSYVAQNRRGTEVKDNEAYLTVELLPLSERGTPLPALMKNWRETVATFPQFEKVQIIPHRFGAMSGSPIEIEIRETNDEIRGQVADSLKTELEELDLINVEIERPVNRQEYQLSFRNDEIYRLAVNPSDLATSLRAYVQGQVVYRLIKNDEEWDVRLSTPEEEKQDIDLIMAQYSRNSQDYLIPFRNLLSIKQGSRPAAIARTDHKRSDLVLADLKEGSELSPLEIAEQVEQTVFPKLQERFPSATLRFKGEIQESRESQGDFGISIIVIMGLIYFMLVILFDSLLVPVLIGAVVPFGLAGVTVAFWGHGMTQYGFFAVIGALGMLGVIVNDAIVMVSSLQRSVQRNAPRTVMLEQVAVVATSRLRPILLTTLTTVVGLFPTAYGWLGYDSMLAEMMLAMGWGLVFATGITLIIVPCLFSYYGQVRR